jgi:excisionase family DNA binding protein
MTDSPWLTVAEAAERAKCGPRLIYREVQQGRLRAARIGNRRDIRIRVDWVDEWLDASAAVHPLPTRAVGAGIRGLVSLDTLTGCNATRNGGAS